MPKSLFSFQVASRQAGFLKLPNDSFVKTIAVALSLCLVCSVIVSTAATKLKPQQVANKLLDKKRNILIVADIINADEKKSQDELLKLFEQVEAIAVDLQSGLPTDEVDAQSFDQRKAAKDPAYRVALDKQQDIAQIGALSKYANVYLVRKQGELDKIILPIKGYGLWSTMYGFLALEKDATTVSGITFYEHGETPGLGGEIENKSWQALWKGKKIVDQQGQPALHLIKGTVNQNTADAEYKVDGLAGASLTSNGVSNLIQFWTGPNGFGSYLENLRNGKSATQASNNSQSTQDSRG